MNSNTHIIRVFLGLIFITMLGTVGYADTVGDQPGEEMGEIPPGALMISEETVIKDEAGNRLTFEQFQELMEKGGYLPEPVLDSDGSLKELLMKKSEGGAMIQGSPPAGTSGFNPGNSKLKEGSKAPTLVGVDMSGMKINEASLAGKVIVLNFWFTKCKPCVMELPDLNKVVSAFTDNNDVIFIAPTFEEKAAVGTFLKTHPFKYKIISDTWDVIEKFGITSYPTNVVIGRDGVVKFVLVGGTPGIGTMLESAIKKAVAETEVVHKDPK